MDDLELHEKSDIDLILDFLCRRSEWDVVGGQVCQIQCINETLVTGVWETNANIVDSIWLIRNAGINQNAVNRARRIRIRLGREWRRSKNIPGIRDEKRLTVKVCYSVASVRFPAPRPARYSPATPHRRFRHKDGTEGDKLMSIKRRIVSRRSKDPRIKVRKPLQLSLYTSPPLYREEVSSSRMRQLTLTDGLGDSPGSGGRSHTNSASQANEEIISGMNAEMMENPRIRHRIPRSV